MPTAGTVTVVLDADSAQLLRELKKASKANQRFARQTATELKKLRAGFNNLGRAIAAIAAGGLFTALVNSANKAIDALAKTADKLGVTTEALAGLRLAAQLTGVETRQLDLGLQRATRRISEAAVGTGEAQAALKELGLDAQELNRLPLEEKFFAIADAFENVTNQADRVRLGFKLFDAEGVALINTLDAGSDALRGYVKEAVELGVAVSRFDAAKIEQGQEALLRTQSAVQGAANQLAIAFAPALKLAADELTKIIKELNQTGAASRFVTALTSGFGIVADAVRAVRISLNLLQGVLESVGGQALNLQTELFGAFDVVPDGLTKFLEFIERLPVSSGLGFAIPGLAAITKDADAARGALESLNALRSKSVAENELNVLRAANLIEQGAKSLEKAQSLALEELPSLAIEKRLAAANAETERLAKNIADLATQNQPTDTPAANAPDFEKIREAQAALAQLALEQQQQSAVAREAIEARLRESLLFGEQQLQGELTALAIQEAQRRVEAKIIAERAAKEAAGIAPDEISEIERQKLVADELIKLTEDLARRRTEIEVQGAKDRTRAEEAYTSSVLGLRRSLANNSIALLQAFAGKSKAIAIALIAIEKAQAIARTIYNTATAVMAAYAVDPSGIRAARVKAIGAANVALIAATGFAQAAQVGGGGAELGTVANPVYTQPNITDVGNPESNAARGGSAVRIVFSGDVYGWDQYIEERVIGAIRDAVDDRDVVIIGNNSRNAQEIIGGNP